MKLKRWIAMLLLTVTVGGLLASCKPQPPVVEGETTAPEEEGGEQQPEGDTWMDIWDESPAFSPLANDVDYDTNGNLANGSWFESFKNPKNIYWYDRHATEMSINNGEMYLEAANFSGTQYEAFACRSVETSEHFEVEFRLKIEYYGNDNGLYVGYNGVRVVIYFAESWVRFNRDRGGNDSAGDIVYTDIGYDWHTYRISVSDRVAKVYIDGVYMASFVPESWGGQNGELAFFAYPSNAINSAKFHIDYVSYTVLDDKNIQITSPAARAVCGQGNADVKVEVSLSDSLKASNDHVSYYLNGVYAGQSSVSDASITFEGLKTGVYSVYAVCGESISVERIFVVDRPADYENNNLVYSNATALQSSYVLRFNVAGSGTVNAGDGFHPFSLSFKNGLLQYTDKVGAKTVSASDGAYCAVVDGGAVWLYCNGKLFLSYQLPYAACTNVASVSGGVSDLRVEAHNGTFYTKDLSNGAGANEDVGNISLIYAVEFEYTKGNDASLILTDGAYTLDLQLAADGSINILQAPQKNAFRKAACNAAEGKNLYRVQVYAGIAQLFVNNGWIASWRMPESVANRNLFVSGGGLGKFQIREMKDLFFFEGNASDADWTEYFGAPGDLSNSGLQVLKVYSQNTEVSATVAASEKTEGKFLLTARYFNSKGVFAGYDYKTENFVMGTSLTSLKAVAQNKPLPEGDVTLTLSITGVTATLYCNGEKIASREVAELNGWGNAGYLLSEECTEIKSYSFKGDGNVLHNATTSLIHQDWTSCFFEMNGHIYVGGEFGTFRSTDGGKSFTSYRTFARNSWNMLMLKSGKLLSLVREGTSSARRYMAYVSSNGGQTWSQGYAVNSDTNAYRFTMNGRVMQTSSGRIIFVSGETENEYMGKLWIYFSDNDGVTWRKSRSEFNQQTTGMNLQEGMVVELENGVLRMYARTDTGFLVYSESTDNGVTWSMEMKNSEFPSVVCAFGVNKDPYTGAIYMCWEYNNTNDSQLVQYPRTRVAFAVSYDNAKTWNYLGEIDELNSISSSTWVHMNLGIWPTKDAILVTTAKSFDGERYNYIVHIPKEDLVPMARFNGVHCLHVDPEANREGGMVVANQVLAISTATGRVYASGDNYTVTNVNGKRTMLSAEIVASFLNGTLTKDGNRVTVKVGNAEYVFEAGSKTAVIAGEEKTMTFEAIAEDGTVKISVEDLHHLLDLTAKQSESGAIILTVDATPARIEYLLAQVGIW